MGSLFLLKGISQTQGSNPGLPTLQAYSLSAEPQGEPKNNEVGSLSLFQWIFQTQELNWDLLHCRQILCQLSSRGSLKVIKSTLKRTTIKNILPLQKGTLAIIKTATTTKLYRLKGNSIRSKPRFFRNKISKKIYQYPSISFYIRNKVK